MPTNPPSSVGSPASAHWFILGFTADDVVSCWQDEHLAAECLAAWRRAGRPDSFELYQSGGDGEYMIRWFMGDAAASVLDAQKVSWREFVVGECNVLPTATRPVLADDGVPQRRRRATGQSDRGSRSTNPRR